MSPGIMDKLKRADKYYVCLLMLCALLANQEFPFRRHDWSSTSLNRGKFMGFLSVLESLGALLEYRQNSELSTN